MWASDQMVSVFGAGVTKWAQGGSRAVIMSGSGRNECDGACRKKVGAQLNNELVFFVIGSTGHPETFPINAHEDG